MLKIVFPGELPDFNTYDNTARRNRFAGAKVKKQATDEVDIMSRRYRNNNLIYPIFIHYHWVCKNKRKDKDNVAFAKKFISDGLQQSKVIPQDTWNVIEGFADTFEVDKTNPRIEVYIYGNFERHTSVDERRGNNS